MSTKMTSLHYNEDDRAQRILDAFPAMEKWQVNVSYIANTQHIVAWHRHQIQTDHWVCIKGAIKVGLHDPDTGETWFEYLSEKNSVCLSIPPGIWHGYTAIEPGSILMYGLTEKYNPDDEERLPPGSFGETWKTENK